MQCASVIMMIRDGIDEPKILAVTNRRFGGYALPGGKCDQGEDPRHAAQRELYEETNLTCVHCDLSFVTKFVNVIASTACEVNVFHARHVSGIITNVEAGTSHRWMRWTELLDESVFRLAYERHFPDGIHHLRETRHVNANVR